MDRKKTFSIDGDVAMVMFQFASHNQRMVPSCIPPKEETAESVPVAPQRPGKKVLDTDRRIKVRVADLPSSLRNKGLEMRNAFFQERKNSQDETYWIVRFVLAQKEGLEVNPNIKGRESEMWDALLEMCKKSYHVRVFENPFFQDRVEIPDKRTLMIECNGRQEPSKSDLSLSFHRRNLYLTENGVDATI